MVLQEYIFYGRTFLTGVHVLQEDMPQWSIYFMVLLEYILRGGHVLQEGMSYGWTCLMGGYQSSKMIFFTMFYLCV